MPDLLDLAEPQGGTAVLFDADHSEGTYSAAQVLRRLFDRLVVLTPRERIAEDVPLVTRLGILRRIATLGIEVWPLVEPSAQARLEEGIVTARDVYTGAERAIGDVALFTYSTARVAADVLAAPLRDAGVDVGLVGDSYAPRTPLAATSEGHAAGLAL